MLAAQKRTVDQFGGEQFTSTQIDVLGPAILRKLKEAERGDALTTAPEERISLTV
jgi:hypothetical protein